MSCDVTAPNFSCHNLIRFSFIHDNKKNADYLFSASLLLLLLLLQTSASHGHSALHLFLTQHTSASLTGIFIHAAGMDLWCMVIVQVTDVACKGVNRLQASSCGAFSSSSSSDLSQSDGNSADTADMGLWCMVMVQ